MPPKAAKSPTKTTPSLGPRVDALEHEVGALGKRVGHLEDLSSTKRPKPPPKEEKEAAPRCPGCSLRVEDQSGDRCVWCGFVFSAALGPGKR